MGLTYQLIKDDSRAPELPKLNWNLKYLLGWEHLFPDEPAKKVFQTHILMLQNRAIYLLNHGKIQQAGDAIYLAYHLSPSNEKTKKLVTLIKTYAHSNDRKTITNTSE